MKIEFYSTYPEYVDHETHGYYYYAFSILPSLCIDNKQIWLHWLFWEFQLRGNMSGVYYIENTVSERQLSISGYFQTLEEAMKALKDCNDWYRPNGTGYIYFTEFGLNKRRQLVYRK